MLGTTVKQVRKVASLSIQSHFPGSQVFLHKTAEESLVKTIQVVVGFRKCPKVVKLGGKEGYLSLNFEAGLSRSAAL